MEALFAANPRNLKLPTTGRHYFRFARYSDTISPARMVTTEIMASIERKA